MKYGAIDSGGYHQTSNTLLQGIAQRAGIDHDMLALAADIINERRRTNLARPLVGDRVSSGRTGGFGTNFGGNASQALPVSSSDYTPPSVVNASSSSLPAIPDGGVTGPRTFINASPEPTQNDNFARKQALRTLLEPTLSKLPSTSPGYYVKDGQRIDLPARRDDDTFLDAVISMPGMIESLIAQQADMDRLKYSEGEANKRAAMTVDNKNPSAMVQEQGIGALDPSAKTDQGTIDSLMALATTPADKEFVANLAPEILREAVRSAAKDGLTDVELGKLREKFFNTDFSAVEGIPENTSKNPLRWLMSRNAMFPLGSALLPRDSGSGDSWTNPYIPKYRDEQEVMRALGQLR